jgi:hypothetical protein
MIAGAVAGVAILGAACAATIWLAHSALATPAVAAAPDIRTCDSSVAVAYPALGGGVQVRVLTPGPDVVRVGIIAGPKAYERVLQQQVTAKNNLAEFSWVDAHGVSAITVSTNKLGICAIPAPAWTNR